MKSLLFLCTGNYYRSRFVEQLFNRKAEEANLNWRSDSRGIAVDIGSGNIGPISENAKAGLARRNIALGAAIRYPRQVTLAELDQADLVIALYETEHRYLLAVRYPGWEDRVTYWNIPDLGEMEAEKAMAQMDKRVADLVAVLEGKKPE